MSVLHNHRLLIAVSLHVRARNNPDAGCINPIG